VYQSRVSPTRKATYALGRLGSGSSEVLERVCRRAPGRSLTAERARLRQHHDQAEGGGRGAAGAWGRISRKAKSVSARRESEEVVVPSMTVQDNTAEGKGLYFVCAFVSG
jgi:hypothetical protein